MVVWDGCVWRLMYTLVGHPAQGPKANYHIPHRGKLWLLPAHMTLSIQLQLCQKPAREKDHFITQPRANVVLVK